MEPRRWDPDDPKRPGQLKPTDRPFAPPYADEPDSIDMQTGEAVPNDSTAISRTEKAAPKKLTKAQLRSKKLTQEVLARRAEGFSAAEIAEDLGVSPSTVVRWITTHRRETQEGEIDRLLDETAVPLAAENLVHGLIAGDKDYTLKTLEGRGVLRRHTDKGDAPDLELPVLVIRVEGGSVAAPEHQLASAGPPMGGHIVGKPALKQIEGTVVQRDDSSRIQSEVSQVVSEPRSD